MPEQPAAFLPATTLIEQFRTGRLTPRDVVEEMLERISRFDEDLHAYVTVTGELARSQAAEATAAYRRGESGPLLGVPVSVKDAFHVSGVETTLGSLVHRGVIAKTDSGVVRRLRAAGAVFTGKTNTAEFGQSATTDNLLGADTANPWDITRTPGGSSGGAAASVAAGLATVAVGSDGGGSIRIPAAFTGLVGIKPTPGLCRDEHGFRAMTEFVSPGPLAWTVADARLMLGALAERSYPRGVPRRLRVGFAARPEGRPVHPDVAAALADTARALSALGHEVVEADLPLDGWPEVFGPLVLDDEDRERGHLLSKDAHRLTSYARASLLAGRRLQPTTVARARQQLARYRAKIAALFGRYDIVLTPTVAVPAFPLGRRPTSIAGEPVDSLWGAFPFAVPFNVAGTAALSLPCGLVDGLPVGAQLAAAPHNEGLLLDAAEELQEALAFDPAPVRRKWAGGPAPVRA